MRAPSERYSGIAKKNAIAATHGSHSVHLMRGSLVYPLISGSDPCRVQCRCDRGLTPALGSRADSKEAHGSPQKNCDSRGVDQERAEFRHPVLARRIRDADEKRSDERAAQAAEAADGDDDQEVGE